MVCAFAVCAAGQTPDKAGPAAAKPPNKPAQCHNHAWARAGPAATEAIDRQPYRIELHLSLDPSARIDRRRRAALLKAVAGARASIRRAALVVTIAGQPSPLASGNLESLEAAAFGSSTRPSTRSGWSGSRPEADTSGLLFTGREYDAATRRSGRFQQHKASVLADAPRALLQFTLELFNPTALITGQEGGEPCSRSEGRRSLRPASSAGSCPRGRSSSRFAWST